MHQTLTAVKRAALAGSICFGILPTPAFAFDWSIVTTESQTVELNSNQFLRPTPAPTLGSYSTLTAKAVARTPTSTFDFDLDGSYRKYWGPGAVGIASEFLNYGLNARYEVIEKGRFDREFVETAWRQRSTALALLNDFGVATNARGFLETLRATGGFDRSISARDTISLFATSVHTSYEPSSASGTPFTDTLARGSWRHSVNSIAAVNVSSEAELLDYENALNTHAQIYRNQAGVETTLSPVLSFRANVGMAVIEIQGVNATIPLISAGAGNSASSIDWIGDAVLTYRVLKNTSLSIIASQSISPSVVGSLFKRDTINATLSHSVNARSALSFSASVNRQTATTTTDFASASVTYSYNFLRDWSAQLTYRYQHRFASTGGTAIIDPITGLPTVGGLGSADSNSIMLVVSNSFTMLPRGN
jgi:hypothetical protein